MDFPTATRPVYLLVDNGSLRAASTMNLRRIAAAVSARVGWAVEPVSLLHSSTVDPGELGGVPAEILEPAIRRRHATGARVFRIVPLFFGPSAALTDYIPERVGALAKELRGLEVSIARPLVDAYEAGDFQMAEIVAGHVRSVIRMHGLQAPAVVLVDHGSPQRVVTRVRDHVATQLGELLRDEAVEVVAASMERRQGAEFDFNEPLLERALRQVVARHPAREIVVALLFISPGRHAGPGGDIDAICRAFEVEQRGAMGVHQTALVGAHPELVDILVRRCLE